MVELMTVTAWLLVALLAFTAGLVALAVLDLVENRRLPRRPVPLPRRRPDFARVTRDPEFVAPLLTGRAAGWHARGVHRRT